MKNVRFIGLDVHAQTIAVAVAEPGGDVRSLGTIANRVESVRKLIRKLGSPGPLRAPPVIAVGTPIAGRPPHRSRRAELPRWALTDPYIKLELSPVLIRVRQPKP